LSAQPQPYSPAYENREARAGSWAFAALVAASAIAIALHARHYLPFLSDDALISLRYARRLLDGHGLSWTDGQPVEGYSNLLWVLLVAAAGALRADLITAARVLGLVCTITIPAAITYSVLREHAVRAAIVPLGAAAAFVAAGAPIAVWAIGGLEQPLLAGLFALSIAAMNGWLRAPSMRAAFWLSLTLGLLCLTPPTRRCSWPRRPSQSCPRAGCRSRRCGG